MLERGINSVKLIQVSLGERWREGRRSRLKLPRVAGTRLLLLFK
jgi:hypothetical protein